MRFLIDYTADWLSPSDTGSSDPLPSLVGQTDRTWIVPLVHRTLASPTERHVWPRYTQQTRLEDACAYWEAAYYLTRVLLGWGDVGLGLQRVAAGRAGGLESPALDLLHAVWNDQGQLDLFALWAWQWGGPQARDPADYAGESWLRDFGRRWAGEVPPYHYNPYFGGSNPLHLGHALGALHDVPNATHDAHLVLDLEARRAVLTLGRAVGWVSTLDRIASRLPHFEALYWSVDVVVRPVGWMGTMSRSKVTGRWYTGKHSVHMLGN